MFADSPVHAKRHFSTADKEVPVKKSEFYVKNKTFTRIAMIAAVYTIVLAPFSFGPIQVRVSEALTVLPLIWKPSIWALTLGCFLTNLIGVATNVTGPIDIVIGTLATFLAAVCTWNLREKTINGIPVAGLLMPVLFNGVFVGIELAWMLNPENMWMMSVVYGFQVAAGELIAVVLGWFLIQALQKRGIFKEEAL